MRNLNGHELNGRTLRVDNAANERTKEEIRNLQSSLGGTFESPYGPEIDSKEAPEAISKAVASLPPEQMFELAKQMKHCIQTNPNEARNMLLQNPQLAYALLQALVVMKVVDPTVALSILHRTNPVPNLVSQDPSISTGGMSGPPMGGWGQPAMLDPYLRGAPPTSAPPVVPPPQVPIPSSQRSMDPRAREAVPNVDPRVRPASNQSFDPRLSQQPGPNVRPQGAAAPNPLLNIPGLANLPSQDLEKAALIMQVLQIPDDKIALLPPEQRDSIRMVKEQIARGAPNF